VSIAHELALALDSVSTPSGPGYTVASVPGAPGFRIGRDAEGSVVLLTPAEDASNVGPPTRLRRLLVHSRTGVRIETSEGFVGDATVGLVELRGVTDDSARAFCGVAATIVELIGPEPGPGVIRAALRHVVALFEPRAGRRSSVLGLWGELLCILESENPIQMVEAWHVETDDRFDFAAPGVRLEVKTTQGGARVHEFDLAQLEAVDGASTRVVSVVTTATQAGSSVADLVTSVQERLGLRVDLAVKLWEMVAETIGDDWISDTAGSRWDRAEAVASLKVMAASSIPRIREPLHEAVLSVRLRVQCEGLPALLVPISLTVAGNGALP
jgi:hypothetical protein